MSRETAEFGQKLNDLIRQTDALLEDLVVLRKKYPAVRPETAKMLENQLIYLSRRIKELSRANNDDLGAGISLLKIKLMS